MGQVPGGSGSVCVRAHSEPWAQNGPKVRPILTTMKRNHPGPEAHARQITGGETGDETGGGTGGGAGG